MRALSAAVLLGLFLPSLGCAMTVHRLAREPRLPAGPAKTSCEEEDWLVLGETRAQIVEPGQTETRNQHGMGAYRVGSDDPVDLTTLSPIEPIVERKRDEVRPFHVRRYIAAGLGIFGAGAMAAGTGIFVSGFRTGMDGSQQVHTDSVAGGAITVGIGFALGIAGLLVNPTHAERTRENAAHYFFDLKQDSQQSVDELIVRHDEAVREECSAK